MSTNSYQDVNKSLQIKKSQQEHKTKEDQTDTATYDAIDTPTEVAINELYRLYDGVPSQTQKKNQQVQNPVVETQEKENQSTTPNPFKIRPDPFKK